MQAPYAADISKLVNSLKPRSILVIDPKVEGLFAAYSNEYPECRIDYLAAKDITTEPRELGRYDLGFVANVLEHMDKGDAGQLIARLRDVHTKCLFVVLPMGPKHEGLTSTWEMADLIGYGMRLATTYERGDKRLQMYGFDIADYKDTPDWLSARYWANPERWDKERW
ncbi:MAG: DUF6231 family protein [Acidiferrobacterales bacterium]